MVQLTPRLDIVRRRDAGRDKQVFPIWGHLDAELRQHAPRGGLWLDTSDLTEEEAVDQVLAQLDDAVIDG